MPNVYLCGFFLQFQDETNTAMYQFVSSRPHSFINWAQAIYIYIYILGWIWSTILQLLTCQISSFKHMAEIFSKQSL